MVTIQLEISTFNSSQRGTVTGQICIQIGNEFFPEQTWNDFPVVILCWWIEAMLRVMVGDGKSAQCLFMDGPFAFDVIRLDESEVEIRAGRRDASPEKMMRTPLRDFAKSLSKAATDAVAACDARGWTSGDLDSLRSLLAALRGRLQPN